MIALFLRNNIVCFDRLVRFFFSCITTQTWTIKNKQKSGTTPRPYANISAGPFSNEQRVLSLSPVRLKKRKKDLAMKISGIRILPSSFNLCNTDWLHRRKHQVKKEKKKNFLMQQRLAKKKARKTTNDWGQGFNLLKKKAKGDYMQT